MTMPDAAAQPQKTQGPKGSKLDAQKDAEYRAEVAAVEDWDTSGWGKWTVTGRVLPERCDVSVAPTFSQGVGAGGRFTLRLQVTRSHFAAVCMIEKVDPSVFEIADVVRSALAFPLDYIAFLNRGAYDVVLDLCIDNETGQVSPIPIAEPTFEGLCFDPNLGNSNVSIPWAAAAVFQLPTALHDLTGAVRYPRRTFEQCWMAVEAVRRHFDPPSIKGHEPRWRDGRRAMCAALKIAPASLVSLDRVAARSRHGELVISINWEMRKRALELAWEIVARFAIHLEGGASDTWRELVGKVES
jgi:hypothetical protein